MTRFRIGPKTFTRLLSILTLAVLIFGVLGSEGSPVSARESRIALFGTVVTADIDGELDVATRKGVVTITIDRKTKIDSKRGSLKLKDVSSGDSVTGYYTEKDDELIAGKLTFRERKAKKIFKHLVGVVVKKKGDSLTVQTAEGEQVTVESNGDPDDDSAEQGSLIVTVVEEDEETGDIDAKAVRTAEETIKRLGEAIDQEISLAQEKLLKVRMSETASGHLTSLYATLDEIQEEAQEKIEAALTEFQETYTQTLDENLMAPPLAIIKGKVLSKTPIRLVVAANGNGHRSFIILDGAVDVELLNGSIGAIQDVLPGAFVEVSVTPQTKISSPIARSIKIIPNPTSPGNSNKHDDTITGTIVLVDNGNSGTQKVIVVDNPDGTEGVAAVTPETTITGDGDELEPGQEIEIVLGDDGFSAEEVVVVPSTTDPISTPAPPIEYKLTGTIREVMGNNVILDDVYLTLDSSSPTTDPLTSGDQIEFTVVVNEQGQWVIVGVEP